MADAETQIKETVDGNDVVLFMKGTSSMPQCGFSSRVAGVLNYMGIEYKDVNVLEDDARLRIRLDGSSARRFHFVCQSLQFNGHFFQKRMLRTVRFSRCFGLCGLKFTRQFHRLSLRCIQLGLEF